MNLVAERIATLMHEHKFTYQEEDQTIFIDEALMLQSDTPDLGRGGIM